MAERRWTVNGLGDFSEVYSKRLKTWVRTSKQVVRPCGRVVASGSTHDGERVVLEMEPGEVWTVR